LINMKLNVFGINQNICFIIKSYLQKGHRVELIPSSRMKFLSTLLDQDMHHLRERSVNI
jgi:hypothetical protein